jgi:hypothetical protein
MVDSELFTGVFHQHGSAETPTPTRKLESCPYFDAYGSGGTFFTEKVPPPNAPFLMLEGGDFQFDAAIDFAGIRQNFGIYGVEFAEGG